MDQHVKRMHKEITAALAAIAKRHGMKYLPDTLRYSVAQVHGRLKLVVHVQSDKLAK